MPISLFFYDDDKQITDDECAAVSITTSQVTVTSSELEQKRYQYVLYLLFV
jgi:hypothetical protein